MEKERTIKVPTVDELAVVLWDFLEWAEHDPPAGPQRERAHNAKMALIGVQKMYADFLSGVPQDPSAFWVARHINDLMESRNGR